MMIDLSGKVAIVTGAASGIGKGISLVLADQGADVVVTDVDSRSIATVAEEIAQNGGKASIVKLDVTDKVMVEKVVQNIIDDFGMIDILVNNAGLVGAANWWERVVPSDEDWDAVMAVNLRGVVNVSEAVAPYMKERRYGKIINIASIAARQGGAGIPHYNASKAAVVSWTQSHALQLAEYDVNVNAICPGLLWTPLFERLIERPSVNPSYDSLREMTGRERFEKLVNESIPMKKEQTPEDIGKLAAFLASDDAHNITGQAINVDGGRRMN